MKLSAPHIDSRDIKSINEVLKSGWVSTSSKTINVFEKSQTFVKQNIL